MANQMIQYKDFAPRITERGPFGGPSEYESFLEVVREVNQWIASTSIRIINVETVVLPDSLKSTSDGVYGVTVSNGVYPVMISQGVTVNYFQCVRVWYRE